MTYLKFVFLWSWGLQYLRIPNRGWARPLAAVLNLVVASFFQRVVTLSEKYIYIITENYHFLIPISSFIYSFTVYLRVLHFEKLSWFSSLFFWTIYSDAGIFYVKLLQSIAKETHNDLSYTSFSLPKPKITSYSYVFSSPLWIHLYTWEHYLLHPFHSC